MRRVLGGSWLLGLVLGLMLVSGMVRAEPVRRSDPELERLLARVAEILAREGVPGAGIALVDEDGLLFAGGVGWADVEQQRPVQADTMFRVGSITKSVVALGIARAWERGVLDLDAPIERLVPEVEVGNPHRGHPITLAHLLEHTAGFDDMRFNETFGAVDVEAFPLADVLAVNPRSRVARWEPGSRHAYSNPGYTVAAAGLERAMGAPFEAVLHAEVLEPLRMTRGRFRFDPSLAERLATGYDARGHALEYIGLLHRPAGSLMASPLDLARLVELWVRRGALPGGDRFLHEDTLARIERTGTLPFAATDVDYGLGNYGDVLHPARSRGHDGGLPGFLSTYRYFPEHAFGYVLLLNATHSARAWVEIRMLLFAYLAQGRTPPQPPHVDIPREALIDHVGHWTFASPRHSILAFLDTLLLQANVDLEGDQLHLRLPTVGIVLPLLPTGPNRFRLPGQSGTSVQFSSDRTGKPVMTVHNLYFERGSVVFARVREHGIRTAWLLLQSAVVSFLVLLLLHLVAYLRRTTGFEPELRLLAPFVVATGSLVGAVLLVLGSDFAELGTPNLRTAGICVLPLVFASASLAGVARTALALVAPHPRPPRLWVRLHAATVSLGALVLSGYLAWHHLIGLRTWAW